MVQDKEFYSLRKKLESLHSRRGRHTELISVYISSGYDISKMTQKLSEEQGTASNIKSKTTRKNVTTALEKILQELKLFRQTPKNGLAVFCGNVAEREGQTDFLLETIIPPKPLSINLYRCSQRFVLNPLYEMLEEKETYGLIVIDRRNADIALLKGKTIEILASLDSLVPGKFRAGGQSAQRFERVIEGMAQDFYKKVGEIATKEFSQVKDLKGIIVGGPGPTKNDFLAAGHLSTEIQNKILGIIDIGYTGESGLEELVNKSKDILAEAEITKEKQIMNKFLGHLARDTGLAAYGEVEVRDALLKGAVDVLLLSEKLNKKRVALSCTNCGHSEERTVDKVPELTCPICGFPMQLVKEQDLIENLTEIAKEVRSDVFLVSGETKEGQQLYGMGGVAAILRFKLSG